MERESVLKRKEGGETQIYLDLSFVQGDRYASICIILHADTYFKCSLLKMISLLHSIVLVSLSKVRCP